MCLIAFAHNHHPYYPFILIANRDEFYNRPTSTLDYWEDHPSIMGGRDLKAKGTWMAMNTSGAFAAITNFRDLQNLRADAKSRGDLPTDFLLKNDSAGHYLDKVHAEASQYNGFNLLVGSTKELFHYSNYENTINKVEDGVHGLSNALLDTPWPKLSKLKTNFTQVIEKNFEINDLLDLLADEEKANDEDLPDTGIPLELERSLSSICIRRPDYGTCCSTVVTIDGSGNVTFVEKTHNVPGRSAGIENINFKIL
jgi:uncharacterized protein with NRDE domain